jgi:N-acetylglutamate synthase-like GNAT family acetyltransferase
MMIRESEEKDIPEIKKMIDSLQVSRKQANWQKKDTGFFEYTKTEEELKSLLNPYFLVAEEKDILGFSLAGSNRLFNEPIKQKGLYWDMLAVKEPGKGTASELFKHFLNLAKKNEAEKITALIPEKPWKNKKSPEFIKKKGFKRIGHVETGENITLGEYQLIL